MVNRIQIDIKELLAQLRQANIKLWLQEGRLRSRAPEGAITPFLRSQIRLHKDAIIDFIQRAQEKSLTKRIEAIPTIASQENYALSNAQRRLWVLDQMEEGQIAYNMPSAIRLSGALDTAALERAIQLLFQRHESLRTNFVDSLPQYLEGRQVINEVSFSLSVKNYQDAVPSAIADAIAEHATYTFDLTKDALLKIDLLQLGQDEHILLFNIHHIISDGWSMGILVNELSILYTACKEGQANPLAILPPLSIQYKDFATWQNQLLESEAIQEHRAFWLKTLAPDESGILPLLNLPTDYPRPAIKTYNGATINHTFSPTLTKQFTQLLQQQGATLFMGITALVKILLYRYTQQQDILIGTPSAGRTHPDLHHQIGFYVNTLVLRNQLTEEDSFTSFLAKVKQTALAAFEQEVYPFDRLVEELDLPRDTSRSAVFDVLLVLQNNEQSALTLGDLEVALEEGKTTISKFDITFDFAESKQGLDLQLEYNTDLFRADSMERLLTHIATLLQSVLAQPATAIGQLTILPKAERDLLLHDFNDTKVAFPHDRTLIDLFEEQVEKTPDNIAVVFEKTTLTYRDLNQQANRVGYYLRTTYDIQSDDIIALQLERSEWMLIAIFGVLKSGAAYLPIASDFPKARVEYMLKDSQAKALLTDTATFDTANQFDIAVENIQTIKYKRKDHQPSTVHRQPSNLAYVIYTSGSTGNPKGVLVNHQGVVNLLHWMQEQYPLITEDCLLQQTTYTFDVSVVELFWWTLSGASLCILSPKAEKDPKEIWTTIRDNKVTTMHLVPSLLQVLLTTLEGQSNKQIGQLRQCFVAGEALQVHHIQQFNQIVGVQGQTKLHNIYGPTEASVYASYFDCSLLQAEVTLVPIGKPVSNLELYILSESKQLVPLGIAGELCISGIGLARGYLNNPKLTAEKFIPHPFKVCPDGSEEGAYLYKTGDLARWLPDGNVEFLGRIDHQLKIRGYRIEAGEIEQALLAQEAIQSIVVIGYQTEQDKELVAYLVAKDTTALPDIASLRSFLAESLPDYMIPTYFVELECLPLTASGKVNRRALPAPDTDLLASGIKYEAASTLIEQKLVHLWESILGRNPIGIYDNFFAIGGHSLRAIRLVALIQQHLAAKIKLSEVFEHPTIASLAALVQQEASLHPVLLAPIPQVPIAENYALSNAQRRLWVIDQMEAEQIAYNIPNVIHLTGGLDTDALEQALQLLFERHESLRTTFTDSLSHQLGGRQVIHPAQFSLTIKDYQQATPARIRIAIEKHATYAFDLTKDTLLKLELLQTGKDKHILLFNMHHIISDAWSMGIFANELSTLYTACCQKNPDPVSLLSPLTIQYKDYADWQNKLLESEEVQALRAFWVTLLAPTESGVLPLLDLPTDYPRPTIKTYNGATISHTFNADVLEPFAQLLQQQGATLFMGVTALVKILLYRYTGQEDILVGTPSAGRTHPDLDHQIGFYLNTLVLRNQLDRADSFTSFLAKVKQTALAAFENELYPFDKLVEELNIPRDTSRSAVFDVLLVLENNEQSVLELGDLEVVLEEGTGTISKFDITFSFKETEQGLQLYVEYNTDLFKAERIDRLVTHIETLLQSVLAQPQAAIGQLTMLPTAERDLLLYDFNTTKTAFPSDKTIVDLFEEQVEKTPHQIALSFEDKQWTYHQLNQLVNGMAHYLRDQYAIQGGDIIALLPERTEWMPIGILAVLKAGAAYLPLSKQLPVSRLAFMIKDSGVKLLLTDSTNEAIGKKINSQVVVLEKINSEVTDNPSPLINSDDLAFVLYTSGSTGQPKGVLMPHQPLVNLITWNLAYSPLAIGSRTTQFASFIFDASFHEIFATWLAGGELVMIGENGKKDLYAFADLIVKEQIDRIFLPFAALQELAQILLDHPGDLSHLKVIQTAGEQLQISDSIIQLFKRLPDCQLENHYGPTEAHVVSAYTLKGDPTTWMSLPPIGQPISNTQLYILDKGLLPVPIGVEGELYIGGVCLANGYVNLPTLTKERFIDNPFKTETTTSTRLYKTGDLARYLPDGNIEYLGRIDHQLKVRGYRVEVGEIEYALLLHPAISQCVVLGKNRSGTNELIAYLILKEGADISLESIRAFLQESSEESRIALPDYMIPSYFVTLNAFPVTASGKVNRKALSQEVGIDAASNKSVLTSGKKYVAARTPIEQVLVEIWETLLDRKPIGIHDDFFAIGGHSLTAIRLIAQIQQQLDVSFPLTAIFQYPTIATIAQQLQKGGLQTNRAGMLLSTLGKPIIFTFPPVLGLAIALKPLADLVATNRSLYAFDFLESEDRLERYYQEIKEQQATGPYTLMGYSAGTNLAFEMVKYMEAKGEEVQNLILFDGHVLLREDVRTEEQIIDGIAFVIDFVNTTTSLKGIKDLFNTEYLGPKLINRMTAYSTYRETVVTEGTIQSTIHHIVSPHALDEVFGTDGRLAWKNFTHGKFQAYTGHGEHITMLVTPDLEKNSRILNQILESKM